MAKNGSPKTRSLLESQKLLAVITVVSVIIISSMIAIKYQGYIIEYDRPKGVGVIGSDHAHAQFTLEVDGRIADIREVSHPEYLYANDYIFLDEKMFIHRVATGATLGLFFESLGMKLTDECLILADGLYDYYEKPFETKELCNDGERSLKMIITGDLVEDKGNYIINVKDKIMIDSMPISMNYFDKNQV